MALLTISYGSRVFKMRFPYCAEHNVIVIAASADAVDALIHDNQSELYRWMAKNWVTAACRCKGVAAFPRGGPTLGLRLMGELALYLIAAG